MEMWRTLKNQNNYKVGGLNHEISRLTIATVITKTVKYWCKERYINHWKE